MKLLLLILLSLFSFSASSAIYLGGSYGYGVFGSDELKEYKVSPKGFNYGGFIGIGRDFVGLEGFYHKLDTAAKIKHDGESYDITTNATAMGAALRFSFQFLYLRLGLAKFDLEQSLDIANDSTRQAAEDLYNIQDGTSKNGVVFGLGFHNKLGSSSRVFIDFTRYQITGIGQYDTVSAGISFSIPDRFFDAGKY